MTLSTRKTESVQANFKEQEFEGIYGNYTITNSDFLEVQRYRFSLLLCGISFTSGLFHWILKGPTWAWLWLIPLAISLGLALTWIHIYLRPLHRALQILWGLGCLGAVVVASKTGTHSMLPQLAKNPSSILLIGPLFAALTGIGFKEFFCFQRPEAIGVTILLPIGILGHLSGIFSETIVMTILISSGILLTILAYRKFGMEAAADVGDKSVFDYLDKNSRTSVL